MLVGLEHVIVGIYRSEKQRLPISTKVDWIQVCRVYLPIESRYVLPSTLISIQVQNIHSTLSDSPPFRTTASWLMRSLLVFPHGRYL